MISVVTVVYNALDDLKYTMNDLLKQTSQDFELVIIDGNSTDGTDAYLHQLEKGGPFSRLIVVSERDSGIYDAMNKGIKHASTNYVVFMNAGDRFYSVSSIERINDVLEEGSFDFIFGDTVIEYPNCYSYRKAHTDFFAGPEYLHFDKAFSHQSLICKRAILERNLFDLNYPITADFKSYHRMIKEGKNFEYLPQPISVFATGGVSDTKRLSVHREKLHFMRREYKQNAKVLLHYFRVIALEVLKAPLRTWYRK